MAGCLLPVWAGLVLLCAFLPCNASAQQSSVPVEPPEPPEYRSLINGALEEYEIRNFGEARALFLRAHAVYPSARTLRGLGMTDFELKEYDASVVRLEAALAAPVRRLEGDLRRETEELLARARVFVGRFSLRLVPAVHRGLRLSLDGAPVTPGPGLTLIIPLGEHLLRVQAPGFLEENRALSVQGNQDERIEIQLRRQVGSGALSPPHQIPSERGSKPAWRSPWLWAGVGAVLVAGVVAGVMLSMDDGSPGGEPADVMVKALEHAR